MTDVERFKVALQKIHAITRTVISTGTMTMEQAEDIHGAAEYALASEVERWLIDAVVDDLTGMTGPTSSPGLMPHAEDVAIPAPRDTP